MKREFNRVAKLKQIRRNLAVHAELSISYWSNRSDFETYTCIVLQACTTYEDAWVREHLYISSWQPALNHPFILKFLKLKSEGWKMQLRKHRQSPIKLSPRLYQRLRRRLFSIGSVPSIHSYQEQAWRILYHISLFTRASYEACQRIRYGEFHTLEVYALYRLANHMEEPGRSSVKSLVGKALLFRNATIPKNNMSLHIPFLAHDNFRSNFETWIRQLIIQHKHVAIPLFLPTHRLREQGYPKLSSLLYNHRQCERRWTTSDIDVDSIAEHLHQTASSIQSTPSKNDQPVEFIAPVIQAVVTNLKALQPQKTESQAIRRVQALEAQLKAAQDQLAAAGLAEETQRPPISPKPNPKRSPCSAPLGSTPKRKARKIEETSQQKLSQMFPPSEVSAPSVPTVRTKIRRPQERSREYFWRWCWGFDPFVSGDFACLFSCTETVSTGRLFRGHD